MATWRDGQWVPRQFSERFAFGAEVGAALTEGSVTDCSWGNDAMPRVEPSDLAESEDGPILWCDSADPEDSEFPTRAGRYVVFDSYEGSGERGPLYIGDDGAEALRVLGEQADKVRAARKAVRS